MKTSNHQKLYIRSLSNSVSSNIEKLDCFANYQAHKSGGTLLRLEEDFLFEDATSIRTGLRYELWDLPRGPEPGPEMPKKKRPQIY
jgi:hypothetical protein